MAAPGLYPQFRFIGQLYFYYFWYLLMSEESSSNWPFWAMLFVQNVHYILTNTGTYVEMWQALQEWRTGGGGGASGTTGGGSGGGTTGGLLSPLPRKTSDVGVDGVGGMDGVDGQAALSPCKPSTPGGSSSSSSSSSSSESGNSGSSGNSDRSSRNREGHGKDHGDGKEESDLVFRLRCAEQDELADVASLVLVTTLATTLIFLGEKAVVEKYHGPAPGSGGAADSLGTLDSTVHPSHPSVAANSTGGSVLATNATGAPALPATPLSSSRPLGNIWTRFLLTLMARLISARISSAVFSVKIRQQRRRARQGMDRRSVSSASPGGAANGSGGHETHEGRFQESFWYFVAVTISCSYACFQQPDLPTRFAFCRTTFAG